MAAGTLLATAQTQVPGLRHFQSHLVAFDGEIEALLCVLRGGVNLVPHSEAGTLTNIVGNAHRQEVFAADDGKPLFADEDAIAGICRDVEEVFGISIPSKHVSWPAVKTEIVLDGVRSQAHHARPVPGLNNAWFVIPGKLSQSAAAGRDIASRVVRQMLSDPLAWPIWERAESPMQPFVGNGRVAA